MSAEENKAMILQMFEIGERSQNAESTMALFDPACHFPDLVF